MLLTDFSISTTKPRMVLHHLKGKNVSLTESPKLHYSKHLGIVQIPLPGNPMQLQCHLD